MKDMQASGVGAVCCILPCRVLRLVVPMSCAVPCLCCVLLCSGVVCCVECCVCRLSRPGLRRSWQIAPNEQTFIHLFDMYAAMGQPQSALELFKVPYG